MANNSNSGNVTNSNSSNPQDPTCYVTQYDTVTSFSAPPCGKPVNGQRFVSCCFDNDVCMGDHICYNSRSEPGASGYYVAGCTDPSFRDASCSNACGDLSIQDIVWNPQSNLWNCCNRTDNYTVTCNHPSDETFQAESPNELKAALASASASALAPSSSASAQNGANSTGSSGGSSSLNTGQVAGIAVGAAVGGVIVLSGLAFAAVALYRWRQRRRREAASAATVAKPRQNTEMDRLVPMYGPDGVAKAYSPQSIGGSTQQGDGVAPPGYEPPPRELEVPGPGELGSTSVNEMPHTPVSHDGFLAASSGPPVELEASEASERHSSASPPRRSYDQGSIDRRSSERTLADDMPMSHSSPNHSHTSPNHSADVATRQSDVSAIDRRLSHAGPSEPRSPHSPIDHYSPVSEATDFPHSPRSPRGPRPPSR